MVKKTTKINNKSEVKSTGSHQEFYVPEVQSQFIDIKKNSSKKFETKSPMINGYDFVKYSIGFSKREGKTPTKLLDVDKKTKLFGENEYLNNPEIDFLFQVIAYADQIESTKNDPEKARESYIVITDKGFCRKKAEEYNREGFEEIKKLYEIDDDPCTINKKILQKLQDYFPGLFSDI